MEMMMMLVSDVLEKAAELIEPEGAWIQGRSARSTIGTDVPPTHYAACSWCASGAMSKAIGSEVAADDARNFMNKFLRRKVWTWNDSNGRQQSEVVAKLRSAARLAREQGK